MFFFLLQMENLEPISQSGVSTTSKILRMPLGLKQKSSTKTVKDFMDGLAWEVLSCNGIRNYKLDLLSYRHSSTLLTLSIPEVLYCNKLSKTVLQKIKFNYYRKTINHQFCLKELETQAYKYFFLNIEKLKMDIFKNEFRICIFVIVFFFVTNDLIG